MWLISCSSLLVRLKSISRINLLRLFVISSLWVVLFLTVRRNWSELINIALTFLNLAIDTITLKKLFSNWPNNKLLKLNFWFQTKYWKSSNGPRYLTMTYISIRPDKLLNSVYAYDAMMYKFNLFSFNSERALAPNHISITGIKLFH